MQTSHLFGLDVLSVKKQEFLTYLDQLLMSKLVPKTQVIFTPNPEQIIIAQTDTSFAEHLHQADWLLPDGIGLVYASRILQFFGKSNRKIKERITGVEVVEHLLQTSMTVPTGQKILIIGGRDYIGSFEGEASEDLQSLKKIQDNLYWTEAYQEKAEILPIEETALAKIIAKLQPALVFVALGAPDQEKWIIEHFNLLQENQVKIAMAVGGSFDFLFAKVKRAPRLWQKMGLEWLWRLLKQPWRGKRQLRLIKFIYLVIKEIF